MDEITIDVTEIVDNITVEATDVIENINIEVGDSTQLTTGINYISSTGILNGLELSISIDDTKFNIGAGEASFVDVSTSPYTIKYKSYSAQLGISPMLGSSTLGRRPVYISLDMNGNVRQSLSSLNISEYSDYCYLGIIGYNFTTGKVVSAYDLPNKVSSVATRLHQLELSLGSFNINGNEYSPSTITAPSLKIQRSAGIIFRPGSNYKKNSKVPDQTLTDAKDYELFFRVKHTSGVWGYEAIPQSDIDPNHYDNLTDLVDITGTGKYTIKTIFFTPPPDYPVGSPCTVFIQYGQVVYDTKQDALDHITDSFQIFPTLLGDIIFRGWLIIKEGIADFTDSSKFKFIPAGKWGLSSAIGGGGSGGGEVNTASNVGASGVGLYKQKLGVDLQFENIAAGSNKVTVIDNPTDKIVKIDIVEGNVSHDNIADIGTNNHAQIDLALTRLANTSGTNTDDETYNTINSKLGLANTISYAPTNPASITGTGARMFGLGSTLSFRPLKTGKVIFFIDFIPTGSGTPSTQCTYRLAYGTGVAPANGAVATGTQFDTVDSGANYAVSVGSPNHNFTHNFYIVSTANTTYWFDMQGTKATGATGVGMSSIRVTIKELLF
jgi:hypothetical protein